MKFYRVEEPIFQDRLHLICDNYREVSDIVIDYYFENNQRKHYLNYGVKHCDTKNGEELIDYFFKESSQYSHYSSHNFSVSIINLEPGKYYPRVFRPILYQERYSATINYTSISKFVSNLNGSYDFLPYDEKILVQSVQQLNTLVIRLSSIFNNVYPIQENFDSFGHEMRNLLILTCTEVEAQMMGILKTHNVLSKQKHYTTQDYVKLNDILKLDQYAVNLPHFPEVKGISPFKDWDINYPTTSLFWYDNYNKVKHDREEEFKKANLKSVINSICALVILLHAQYGANIPHWKELIGTFFSIDKEPSWEFEDMYLPPFKNGQWLPENLE